MQAKGHDLRKLQQHTLYNDRTPIIWPRSRLVMTRNDYKKRIHVLEPAKRINVITL